MIREILIGIFLCISLVALPWWATLAFAVLSLFISTGYVALGVGIVLDVVFLSTIFPIASVGLLIAWIAVRYVREHIFAHDTMRI